MLHLFIKNNLKYITTYVFLISFLFSNETVFAQQTGNTSISGIVNGPDGKPIPFITVGVVGTVYGTITDADGTFKLNVPQALPFTLKISGVGYNTKEVALTTADPVTVKLASQNGEFEEVVVTARRRREAAQDIPIPISVIGGKQVTESGAFNVNRVKQLIPTVQLYSSNPRNTTLNIRGLGSTFGLTNDGVDPGVGFYIDGVYYARPAATALDFVDIERIEVLRGPQGTLFGKNTTAGAFNITSKAPSFKPGATFEVSYGNYGYIQAKSSVTGGFGKKFAGRLSFSGTQRNGLIYNEATQKSTNDINNIGVRGQLLYTPTSRIRITLAADAASQKPDGYAQVVAGIVKTKRADYRQFNQIIADLNYTLPTENAFDRKIDQNTPWRSDNELGGVSLNIDAGIGKGTLTSTSAWRYWNWNSSNDRDFTALSVLSLSQAPSKHQQWSQEVRYAGNISSRVNGVLGVYGLAQKLESSPYATEESGDAQWRFSQSTTSPLWATPGLFDGYGIRTYSLLNSFSGAAFANIDWSITERWHLLPGLRYNYDQKSADYDRKTYGGLQTNDPALIALKKLVYTNQAFSSNVSNQNVSGQLTLAYKANDKINAFATYSNSYKPIGINLGGLPTSKGKVMTELAEVKPEYVTHVELGVKTSPLPGSTFNIAIHNTDIKDYQTQVQTAEVGVNRGYLANAEKVRVWGIEADASTRILRSFSVFGALAYTDGKYVSFKNAPVPLEETGATNAFKDISGGRLPGISNWAGSVGAEYTLPGTFVEHSGNYFAATDVYYRSAFSSSPSPSAYLNIDGYSLLNGRIGFKTATGLSFTLWSRNLLNKNYYEQLLPAAGNAGQYAAVLGDPRTYGISLRYTL